MESQASEVDTRIFVKMYVDAVKSGLLADMGAEKWHTLCALAAFMNEKGECYPTQEQIARRIGKTTVTANRRIQRLLKYRWNGEPVISVTKHKKGEFVNNRYKVLPNSGLTIFNWDK